MKHHHLSAVENMMINIMEEGHQKIWNMIEQYHNPLKRCAMRKIYAEAIKRMEE